jgi:hypothetical protein
MNDCSFYTQSFVTLSNCGKLLKFQVLIVSIEQYFSGKLLKRVIILKFGKSAAKYLENINQMIILDKYAVQRLNGSAALIITSQDIV